MYIYIYLATVATGQKLMFLMQFTKDMQASCQTVYKDSERQPSRFMYPTKTMAEAQIHNRMSKDSNLNTYN